MRVLRANAALLRQLNIFDIPRVMMFSRKVSALCSRVALRTLGSSPKWRKIETDRETRQGRWMGFSTDLMRGEYGISAFPHEFLANDPVHARYVKKCVFRTEKCGALAWPASYHRVIRFSITEHIGG